VLEKFFKIPTATELYFQIAKGKVDLTKMRELENKAGLLQLEKKVYVRKKSTKESPIAKVDKSDTIIIGENFKDIDYKMASCCNPIPGDDIFGFITVNDGIKVHRYSCSNAEHLMSKMAYRCIKSRWESSKLKESLASITVYGIDRIGLVNRITEIISNQHNVNMKSISFETNDGIFEGSIKVLVYDTEHLKSLMNKFEQVEGVQRVVRQSED
jgi:GTP pyrophosphokinase